MLFKRMKEKSIGKNAILNLTKTVLALIFPLVTFPYISRTLRVEDLGKINFVNSIISYFIVLATLGVRSYGVREGAAVRGDQKKFQIFYTQVFTITLITTAISYFIMFFAVLFIPELKKYLLLFVILGLSIILNVIGNEWVCAAYEDYFYITVRSIMVQCLSFILIFAFVRNEGDVYKYAAILVFSSSGANLFNVLYNKKYVKNRITLHPDFNLHLKPMIILFASILATSVYISSDMTVLGGICGEYYTGLYGASTKLYSVLKNLISAMIIVTIPRFSYYFKNGMTRDYNILLEKISKTMTVLAIPASLGVFMLSKEIILLLSGEQYIEATTSLRILAIAVMFVAASGILSPGILIPMGFEKYVLYTTVGTAGLNVFLNVLMVGRWQHNAAAFTTLISECAVAVIYFFKVKSIVQLPDIKKQLFHAAIGSAAIIIVIKLVNVFIANSLYRLVVSVICSIGIYGLVLIILKDEIVIDAIKQIRSKLH